MKIFVSYSRRDANDFAKKISDILVDEHSIFTDVNNIQVGEDWSNTIEDNIASCDIFILIVTFAALKSKEVEKEVLLAKRNKKKIIPCFYRRAKANELKCGLERLQGIEFDTEDQLGREIYYRINMSGQSPVKPKPSQTYRGHYKTENLIRNIVKIKGGFYEPELVDKIFKNVDHKGHLMMYLVNSPTDKLEEGKNWNFDQKSLVIFNNSQWNIYWGKSLDWRNTLPAWKRFFQDDKGNSKGVTRPIGLPLLAEFTISEEEIADIGRALHIRYKDKLFSMFYELLKIIDEETIIGKVYSGKFPRGKEIGNFSMSRQYDLDFIGEIDFLILFNSNALATVLGEKQLTGTWNVKLVTDSIPPLYQKYIILDTSLGIGNLKNDLIQAISESTSEQDMNILYGFDNRFRMITQDLVIGKMTSIESYKEENIGIIRSNIERILMKTFIQSEISDKVLPKLQEERSKMELSSLELDNKGNLRINILYILQRVSDIRDKSDTVTSSFSSLSRELASEIQKQN